MFEVLISKSVRKAYEKLTSNPVEDLEDLVYDDCFGDIIDEDGNSESKYWRNLEEFRSDWGTEVYDDINDCTVLYEVDTHTQNATVLQVVPGNRIGFSFMYEDD